MTWLLTIGVIFATGPVAASDLRGADATYEHVPVGQELDPGDGGTRSGECLGGGCTNFSQNYPLGTFSTTSSSFVTVANDIWQGNYAFYSVTSGCIYEWTLCSGDGAFAGDYDSQLSLFNQSGTTAYCYSDDFCGDDAKIRWTATFTGTVRVLVSGFSCVTDFYDTTLKWRRESCPPPPQPDLTPYQPAEWTDKIPIGITQLPGSSTHNYAGPYNDNQNLYFNWASLNQGGTAASNYTVRVEITGYGVTFEWGGFTTAAGTFTRLSNDQGIGTLTAGTHTFKLWLDYDSDVAESNESNNYYERTINVIAAAQPDLTPYQPPHWNDEIPIGITQLNAAATHDYSGLYYDNQTLYFNAASGNVGTVAASNYTVHFEITGYGVSYSWGGFTTPAGGYTPVSIDQGVGPLSAGPHTFRLWVDYDSDVVESNESNNYYERTINVAAANPDIAVAPAALTFDCPAQADDCFTISNDGNDVLQVTGITKPSWATLVPPPPYAIPAGGDQEVCVSTGCGACSGTDLDGDLAISSNDPDEPTTGVTLNVGCPPISANLLGAVSRSANPSGPAGVCDIPINLAPSPPSVPRTSEMHFGGITQVILTYDDTAAALPVTIEEDSTCPAPPSYSAYTGSSAMNCAPAGNLLTCSFTPGLENARTYRLTVPHGAGTAFVEIRALFGDTDSSGRVNGVDRSNVVSAWTGGGFSCTTDIESNGTTKATDRSLVVGVWTSPGTNCAP